MSEEEVHQGRDNEQPGAQPVVRSGPRLEAALAYLLELGRLEQAERAERAATPTAGRAERPA